MIFVISKNFIIDNIYEISHSNHEIPHKDHTDPSASGIWFIQTKPTQKKTEQMAVLRGVEAGWRWQVALLPSRVGASTQKLRKGPSLHASYALKLPYAMKWTGFILF